MYLNASTDSIEIILGGTVTANQLQWNVSYQDITSTGMTLPQSAGAGLTNNATLVTMVAAPAASTTRQVTNINVYNADTATATVTVRKDVSGTKYVLMRIALTTLDVLMWSRENGWRLMSASTGATYTFSTGLTNTSGTVTANLSTGVAGGQSVIGGTAASNNLTLSSTSNATKGKILFGTSAYDEVNNRLGIGTASPAQALDVRGQINLIAPSGSLNRENLMIAKVSDNSDDQFGIANATAVDGRFTPAFYGYTNGTYNSLVFRGFTISANDSGTNPLVQFQGFITSNNSDPNNGTLSNLITRPLFSFGSSTVYMQMFAGGNLLLQSGGTFTDAGFRLDVNGTARFQGNVTISTKDIVTDTTTGSKIATGTTQKLGFWNATPIAQPTTAVAAATRVGGGGTTLTDTDTFDGYTLAQVVKALRNAGLLA